MKAFEEGGRAFARVVRVRVVRRIGKCIFGSFLRLEGWVVVVVVVLVKVGGRVSED